MNPGTVGRGDRLLPQRLREREERQVRGLGRAQAADDLHELHQRHRIEEVQPAEPIGPRRGGRQLGDAERRGVRHDQRVVSHDRFHRGVRLPLGLEVLDDRLDHQVAARERVDGRRARQVRQRRVARLGGHLPLLHSLIEEAAHPPEPLVENRLVHLPHDGAIPALRADLRDAGSHEPAAEDADGLDGHEQAPDSGLQAPGPTSRLNGPRAKVTTGSTQRRTSRRKRRACA